MTRVQIPAYTDRWMTGDRFGEIVKVSKKPMPVHGWSNRFELRDVARVKLDKSGKTLPFILDDCTVVS